MNNEITPPPELVEQWLEQSLTSRELAAKAFQAGADQELEACCEWLDQNTGRWDLLAELRTARRPKPPSLKKQALALVSRRIGTGHVQMLNDDQVDTIRRALEQLDD